MASGHVDDMLSARRNWEREKCWQISARQIPHGLMEGIVGIRITFELLLLMPWQSVASRKRLANPSSGVPLPALMLDHAAHVSRARFDEALVRHHGVVVAAPIVLGKKPDRDQGIEKY